MKYRVRIRQERPQHTKASFSFRTWELFVFNPNTREHEYHGFTLSFDDAISLACRLYHRPLFPHMAFVQEVTA